MKSRALKRHFAPLILRIPSEGIPTQIIKPISEHWAPYFANAGTA